MGLNNYQDLGGGVSRVFPAVSTSKARLPLCTTVCMHTQHGAGGRRREKVSIVWSGYDSQSAQLWDRPAHGCTCSRHPREADCIK